MFYSLSAVKACSWAVSFSRIVRVHFTCQFQARQNTLSNSLLPKQLWNRVARTRKVCWKHLTIFVIEVPLKAQNLVYYSICNYSNIFVRCYVVPLLSVEVTFVYFGLFCLFASIMLKIKRDRVNHLNNSSCFVWEHFHGNQVVEALHYPAMFSLRDVHVIHFELHNLAVFRQG